MLATAPGSPLTLATTTFRVDLSAYAGTTVRLRLVEVDTLQFFNVGVDDVQLVAGSGVPVDPVVPAEPVPAAPSFTG